MTTATTVRGYAEQLVKDFYDRHRGQGFFSASKGDGYRTLNHSDLQEVALMAQEHAEKVEEQWTQRVGQFLAALDDLAGQAQDEIETSTPEDAISWARAQFAEIFKVTE